MKSPFLHIAFPLVPHAAAISLALAGLAARAGEPSGPKMVGAGSTPGLADVRAFGARGDGKTDDTDAFLRAVAAARKGDGRVIVPRGYYRITRPIPLKNISLEGTGVRAWPADIDALPAVIPAHRDGPAFVLGAGSALSGIDITYHWETEPQAGPPAVLITGIGVYIRNIRIRYAWDGILADGEHNIGRLNIENVFMVSIRNVGVRVTGTWDVPRMANVEVWNAGPVRRGLEHGVGFLLGKNDLIRMTDCFVFGMHDGFMFQDRIEGCRIAGGTWGVLNGCATDFCVRGLVVTGSHTLSINGGSFWDHQESLIIDGKDARVRLSGSECQSNGAPAVSILHARHAAVTGCSLVRPMANFKAPAVNIEGGEAVVLQGNILDSTAAALSITPAAVSSTLIQGNLFRCMGAPVTGLDSAAAAEILKRNRARLARSESESPFGGQKQK